MVKRSRKNQTNILILKVFAICFAFIILIAGLFYYRREVANNQLAQQAAQERLEKEQALKQKENFIKVVAPIAQREDKQYGVLPSVTIAQACLESNYGQSTLAKDYNNLFGVKGTDPNTSKVLTTKEFVNGQWETIHGRFQIYDSYDAAIRAHTMLFVKGTTWNPNQYQHVLAAKDYKEQAKALETDGYATDPSYANKLINLIEEFNLNQYDN